MLIIENYARALMTDQYVMNVNYIQSVMNVNYNIEHLANNINHSLTAREASLRASLPGPIKE